MRERAWAMSESEQRRLEVIQRFREGKLTRSQAASLLGLSVRQVYRLRAKLQSEGPLGLVHGNVGREPPNKTPKEVARRIKDLAEKKYFDVNFVHMREHFLSDEDLVASYATIRRCCLEVGIAKHLKRIARRRREYRTRMACEGVLLQMDGSPHKWNGKDTWTLIGMIDDATSEITSARFFCSETTVGCMSVLTKTVERKGVPLALYTDKAGIFGGNKRQDFSQFERACSEFGITILYAHSPKPRAGSKGPCERFRTG